MHTEVLATHAAAARIVTPSRIRVQVPATTENLILCHQIRTSTLPRRDVDGNVIASASDLTSVSLPRLSNVTGYVNIYQNDDLEEIFPSLVFIEEL